MSGGQVTSNGAGGIIRGEFVENTNIRFLAYLLKDGAALTNLMVQGFVSVAVYERSGATPNTPIYTNSNYVSSTVAVLLVPSTSGWSRGGVGANFDLTFISTYFTQVVGMNYRFEFTIPLLPSGNMTVIYELFCKGAA